MTVLTRPRDLQDGRATETVDQTVRPVERRRSAIRLSQGVHDGLFLTATVAATVLPYVGGLGFYADDWDGLGFLVNAQDQSIPGLYQAYATPPEHALFLMRPLQILIFTASFWAFGTNPLGYHLLNGVLLLALVLFGSFLLRTLGAGQLIAVMGPAVFAVLPHASSDRFWIATAQINFCLLMFFVSVYCDVRAVRTNGLAELLWKSLSLIVILLGGLAYEIALPLVLMNVAVVIWLSRDRTSAAWAGRARLLAHSLPGPILVGAVMIFKALTTTRIQHDQGLALYLAGLFRHALDPGVGPLDSGINVFQAASVAFGTFGLWLPVTATQLVVRSPNLPALVIAVGIGLATGLYLWRITGSLDQREPTSSRWKRLLVSGIAVFFLGQSIFLLTWDVNYAPAGIANRVMLASMVGVAMALVGGLGWAAGSLTPRFWRGIVVGGFTVLTLSGSVTLLTLAGFWTQAASNQARILDAIQREFPTIPEGAAILLDGACPYVGPAVVFEAPWDLSKALRARYRVTHFRADVVTPRLTVTDHQVSTVIYGAIRNEYAYGPNLLIYNVRTNQTVRLIDAETARRYFNEVNPNFSSGCAPSREGFGEHVIG